MEWTRRRPGPVAVQDPSCVHFVSPVCPLLLHVSSNLHQLCTEPHGPIPASSPKPFEPVCLAGLCSALMYRLRGAICCLASVAYTSCALQESRCTSPLQESRSAPATLCRLMRCIHMACRAIRDHSWLRRVSVPRGLACTNSNTHTAVHRRLSIGDTAGLGGSASKVHPGDRLHTSMLLLSEAGSVRRGCHRLGAAT